MPDGRGKARGKMWRLGALTLVWLAFALLASVAAKWGLKGMGFAYPQDRALLNFAGQSTFLFLGFTPVVWRWWRLHRELLP